MGKLAIPTIGKKGNTEHPKVNAAIEALNAILGEENKVKGSGVEEGTITDKNLVSSNNLAYRLLLMATGNVQAALAAGTYILGVPAEKPIASGAAMNGPVIPPYFQFVKADSEVGGKTQKLRTRVQMAVNAAKPTIKFTFGLYPITVAGGVGETKFTLGTVVSGSTVEVNEPPASTITSKESSDFAIPSDGAYMFGFVTSAEINASVMAKLSAQLQTRSV